MNFVKVRDAFEIRGGGDNGRSPVNNTLVDLVLPTEHEGTKVNSIGYGAFKGYDGIGTLVIPGNIETIGKQAFYGCLNVKKIEMQEGVKTIKEDAFSGCNKATEIIIPSSVETIEYGAFLGMDKNVEYVIKVIGRTEKPAGWDSSWNKADKTVIWDYKA